MFGFARVPGMGRALAAAALLGACTTLAGCFFYDSRWGQAKASQKRVAAHATPGMLRSDSTGSRLKRTDDPSKPVEQLRIRAYATPHYMAALVDGEAQFTQALNDANPTLAHDLSFRLELSDYRVWSSNVSDDDLSALLQTLKREDTAQDVDWVVVLASPRHMVATSPDQLGVGSLLGRHLAIRAMSDADEFDAIETAFTELSEDEKSKLYAARKRHKTATVLLHELGHTLGMPHELDQHSMMSPQYDTQANAFSRYAARLGQQALKLRATTPGTELYREAAQGGLNVLHNAPQHTWEPHTFSEVEALLEFHAQQMPSRPSALPSRLAPQPAAAPRAAVTNSPPSPSRLSASDAAVLAKARDMLAAGHVAEARALANPLFEVHVNVLAVQELRCQLAMKAGLSIDEEKAECAPLLRLSGSAL